MNTSDRAEIDDIRDDLDELVDRLDVLLGPTPTKASGKVTVTSSAKELTDREKMYTAPYGVWLRRADIATAKGNHEWAAHCLEQYNDGQGPSGDDRGMQG